VSEARSFVDEIEENRRRQLEAGAVTQSHGGSSRGASAVPDHIVVTEIVRVLRHGFHAVRAMRLASATATASSVEMRATSGYVERAVLLDEIQASVEGEDVTIVTYPVMER
jgi:hypothetical protein